MPKITLKKEIALYFIEEEWDGEKYLREGEEPNPYKWVEDIDDGKYGRWDRYLSCIIQHKKDGTYWRHDYTVGLTEMQDYNSWDYADELEFYQVEPIEETIVVKKYLTVKDPTIKDSK